MHSEQDKGRGVVLMDRPKYTEKCLELLQTNQLTKLNHYPTKSIEGKIQRILRKIKNRLSPKDYYQLYIQRFHGLESFTEQRISMSYD